MNWLTLPRLTSLDALGTDWQRVAEQSNADPFIWCGDLSDRHVLRLYRHMVYEQRTVVQVNTRIDPGRTLLFAKMAGRAKAAVCIAAAHQAIMRDLRAPTPRRTLR